MADYSGMTYGQIIIMTEMIAESLGFKLTRSKVAYTIDEAMYKVGLDVLEKNEVYSVSYPGTSTFAFKSTGIMYPHKVFGDDKEFTKLDYEEYRDMFLGTASKKTSDDTNYYYTILDDNILLEPSVTGFTNLGILNAPLFTKYEHDGSVDSNEPELNAEYRMLVCYKIIEMLSPANLANIAMAKYKIELKASKKHMNRKYAKGHAEWWNPLDIDTETRNW